MIGREITTNKNNKYYFKLCNFGGDFTSKEYESETECLKAFCKEIETNEDCWWGQFIIHHYADEFLAEAKEVVFALSGLLSKNR